MIRTPLTSSTRRVLALLGVAGVGAALAACSDEAPTQAKLADSLLELTQEVNPNDLILVDAHHPRLVVGSGIILRARIMNSSGQTLIAARPAWRSTNPSVVSANPLPDSAGADGARVAVGGLAVGTAMVIASYNGLADTSVVTVIARSDTGTTNPPPPPPRPVAFDATIAVRGFVASADTGTTGTLLLPGATVTLTRLPLAAGDSIVSGVTPVTVPTVFGTLTVDATSQVVFRNVPQSRFRVNVAPPPGTPWQPAEFTYPPPQVAAYGRVVTLRRP
jgi:hypothetical protein